MKFLALVALLAFVINSVRADTLTTRVFPAGVICDITIPAYSKGVPFQNASLFLSDQDRSANAPVLLNAGSGMISAVTYVSGLGLLADIGVVELSSVETGSFTERGLTYSRDVDNVVVGHTYLLTSFKPSTGAASLAFTVKSRNADDSLSLSVGVFEYIVDSRRGGSTTKIQVGSLWTSLSKPKSPSACDYVLKTVSCTN